MAETMPFGLWTRVQGPIVLGGVQTDATWRIPLDCLCAATICGLLSNYFDHVIISVSYRDIINHNSKQGNRRLHFARVVQSHHPSPADPCSESVTMHCQWVGKTPKIDFSLKISSPSRRWTDRRP